MAYDLFLDMATVDKVSRLAVLAKSNDKTESKTLITDDIYRSTSSKSIY